MLKRFDGDVLLRPDEETDLETDEGPAAVKEAIEVLKSCNKMQAFSWN